MSKKIYTIQIESAPVGMSIWYRDKIGETYQATLTIHENTHGNPVPVFKLSVAPFFHVYPNHCKVIDEKIIG